METWPAKKIFTPALSEIRAAPFPVLSEQDSSPAGRFQGHPPFGSLKFRPQRQVLPLELRALPEVEGKMNIQKYLNALPGLLLGAAVAAASAMAHLETHASSAHHEASLHATHVAVHQHAPDADHHEFAALHIRKRRLITVPTRKPTPKGVWRGRPTRRAVEGCKPARRRGW